MGTAGSAINSSPESVVEQSKERYYIALRQTQGTIRTAKPDLQPWLAYFLGVLTEQKSRLEKKIARERILLGDLPELSLTATLELALVLTPRPGLQLPLR